MDNQALPVLEYDPLQSLLSGMRGKIANMAS